MKKAERKDANQRIQQVDFGTIVILSLVTSGSTKSFSTTSGMGVQVKAKINRRCGAHRCTAANPTSQLPALGGACRSCCNSSALQGCYRYRHHSLNRRRFSKL